MRAKRFPSALHSAEYMSSTIRTWGPDRLTDHRQPPLLMPPLVAREVNRLYSPPVYGRGKDKSGKHCLSGKSRALVAWVRHLTGSLGLKAPGFTVRPFLARQNCAMTGFSNGAEEDGVAPRAERSKQTGRQGSQVLSISRRLDRWLQGCQP
jgi:hypothetical protein